EYFVGGDVVAPDHLLVELDPAQASSALAAGLAARFFDQDVAHGPRGGEVEVAHPRPAFGAAIDGAQIRFVHQSGGLQRAAGGNPGEFGGSEVSQLLVDGGKDRAGRFGIPSSRLVEQPRYVDIARHRLLFPDLRLLTSARRTGMPPLDVAP